MNFISLFPQQVGLVNTITSVSDGVLSCQFTHTRIFNSTRIVKDLQATTWYLMVATGSATGGIWKVYKLFKHIIQIILAPGNDFHQLGTSVRTRYIMSVQI